MLDPPSGTALPSGPSCSTAGLDLFWTIQTLLWFRQFLLLLLRSVKKVVSEWYQPGGKQGADRARGKVPEQHPAHKEKREGAPQRIPSHLQPMLRGGISPAPFPDVSASSSSLHLPGVVAGQEQWQHSSKGLSCPLCFTCRALPCNFHFSLLILTMYCHPVLALLICPPISISECWLLCL